MTTLIVIVYIGLRREARNPTILLDVVIMSCVFLVLSRCNPATAGRHAPLLLPPLVLCICRCIVVYCFCPGACRIGSAKEWSVQMDLIYHNNNYCHYD